jgi:GTP pyrophosphokinase
MVQVVWKKQHLSCTLARLVLRGRDRLGIIHEITHNVSLVMCVNIRSFSLITHDNIFDAELEVYVQKPKDLDNLIEQLGTIKDVETVKSV